MDFDTSSLVPIGSVAGTASPTTAPSSGGLDTSSLVPLNAASPSAISSTDTPDRVPTAGQVGQQFGYGILQGIPNAVAGAADMVSKPFLTDPLTGNNWESELADKAGLGNLGGLLPPLNGQVGPGNTIKSALSTIGLNPDNLPAPQSGPERIANMAGQGTILAVAPELGGLGDAGLVAKIGSLARPAVTGAVSGAASQGAAEVVPEPFKPAAAAVGALAGGLGAEGAMGAAGKTAAAIGDVARPLVSPEAAAGKVLANAAESSPQDLIDTITNAPRELVPGSQSTTFQLTGDMGLGELERSVAAQNPAMFNEARATQNAARLDALSNIQAEGHPEAVADTIRQQLGDIDQQSQAAVDQAQQKISGAVDQMGNQMTAEQIGDQARTALQTQLDASKANESWLWKIIDPNNALNVLTSPIKRAMQAIYGSISPELATNVTPAETALANVVNDYGTTLPFNRLTDLRSVVSQAMRAAKSPLQPNDMAYGRLAQLRGAIEDAISDTVQGKVAQEQQAVAAGRLAPEDTIAANLQNKVQDWYANREAGTVSQEGAGENAGVGPNAVSGSGGTGIPAGGQPVNAQGDQGLSQNAGNQLVDQAAADRLATASAATKARKEAFGAKPVANILQRAGATYDYKMPSGDVASNLWRPGPNGGTGVNAVLTAAKNAPEAIEAIRSAAANSLRAKGPLTADGLAKWKAQHSDALSALEGAAPGSMARFENVERTTENLANVARTRKEASDAIQKGALGRIMRLDNPDDVTKTIGAIFGKTDSVKTMRELADTTRKDPVAFEGLRKAIVDHMESKLISNTEAGTSGRNLIKADQFQTFLGKNHQALRQVFSDDELNSMQAIAQDLKRANRSITGVKLPGGSNTAQDLAAIGKHSLAPTLLNKLMTLASESGGIYAGSMFGPVGSLIGYVGAHVIGSMRMAGIDRIQDLVRQAMLDPDLAKTLLMKAPKRPDAGSEVTLSHKLAKLGMMSGALSAAQIGRGT